MTPRSPALRTSTALFTTLAAFLAGCAGETSSAGTDGSGGAPATGPTYYADAKPILDAKCATCHTEGGIAPFALETYDQVAAQKVAIAGAMNAGTMPPWPPSESCSDYLGPRALTADQLAVLNAWIDEGAAEGDPAAEAPPIDSGARTLSRTDLTLAMPEAYTPQQSPDDYRCFLVDWPNDETTYVTGFGVQPGVAAMVHHVIAYLATPDTVATYQALDEAEPGPGYTCFGGSGGGKTSWIGGWAPGALGSDFPAGTGIEIPPGSKVILQLHYNTLTTAAVPDQTSVVLKIDQSVEKKAFVVPWTNPSWVAKKTMDIPAHTADASHEWESDPALLVGFATGGAISTKEPFTLHTAGLHMHTRGTSAITEIVHASGESDCVLDIPSWNFHWQGSYELAAPKTIVPGDKIRLECHWNNSGATDMNWGEGTGDEMCLGTFYVTQ